MKGCESQMKGCENIMKETIMIKEYDEQNEGM
jgi:hypothetical protein